MINLIKRLGFGSEAFRSYREFGFLAADTIKQFISCDALASLKSEMIRELVMIDSRFMTCLYEGYQKDSACCQEHLDILKKSASLMEDERIALLLKNCVNRAEDMARAFSERGIPSAAVYSKA